MDISEFKKATAKVKVKLDEGEVCLTYFPRAYTAKYEQLLLGLEEAKSPAGALCEALLSVLATWDLTCGRKPAPLNLETLQALPTDVVIEFLRAVRDDLRPNRTSGEPSVAG